MISDAKKLRSSAYKPEIFGGVAYWEGNRFTKRRPDPLVLKLGLIKPSNWSPQCPAEPLISIGGTGPPEDGNN